MSDREKYLSSKPLRAREVTVENKPDGTGLLKVPVRGRWPFRLPPGATKSIELDELGLAVWNLCDGRMTLREIIANFAARYRLNLREAEVATLRFIQMLASRRLIGPE